jgi:hypothetical protein
MGVGRQKHAAAKHNRGPQKPILGSLPRELGIIWVLGYARLRLWWHRPGVADQVVATKLALFGELPGTGTRGTTLPFNELRIQNEMKLSCGGKPRRYSCSQRSREV